MDPQKITELANLFRYNGDKILNSEFTLTLSGSLLRALNDSFTLIADSVEIAGSQKFQVAKPINSKSPVFRDLQLVHDFVQKTTLLCIVHYPTEEYFSGTINISKFRALERLETRKINISQVVGIQPLRAQLQQLICIKSIQSVDEIITHCGGDRSNGFVWNELKIADFSYNNLKSVDTSLEFAQYLQQLNLRHNQLVSVEAIKWLPHLKSLDLSYNCLPCIPQFHADAYKRLQRLNMSNNYVEDLMGIVKMDALTELDLSDNCLLDHTCLLPLSVLMTLSLLNLYGNPLHCHPKHRLATAQFLHKNTSTVKFLLDLEPLSKNEKAVTGKQQLRNMGSLSRFAIRSSTASISSNSNRGTPSTQTPSSSIGSLQSFKFQDSTNAADAGNRTSEIVAVTKKKTTKKIRTVEIEDDETAAALRSDQFDAAGVEDDKDLVAKRGSRRLNKTELLTQSMLNESNADHLETKKHIEILRGKYGAEWLQSGNADMVHSVLGIESEQERNASRQFLDDYLGEFSEAAMQAKSNAITENSATTVRTSTPLNEGNTLNPSQDKTLTYTPIKKTTDLNSSISTENNDNTLYLSIDKSKAESVAAPSDDNSLYTTATESQLETEKSTVTESSTEKPEEDELKNIYATTEDAEPEDSEPEEEETYIVYTNKSKTALFLTLSENFLREKDTWSQKTKTKWSLRILESCERLKANTIQINFDTVKADKKERIYTVEDGLCQELEKKLRDILSKRDLSEMDQTIYRCVNCSCQFSRENKISQVFGSKHAQVPCCPNCRSTFIAEMHDAPRSLEKPNPTKFITEKLSPAAIVEESPITTPLVVVQSSSKTSIKQQQSAESAETEPEYSNSIGSANSLNESSSCSKISAHSQSSFDSNQSVVGSTNSERDLEFNVNGESDVDIISNPSQSSIEVLDQPFYEGRISQQPNLETIADNSYKQTFTDWIPQASEDMEGLVMKPASMSNIQNNNDFVPSNITLTDEKDNVTREPVSATNATGPSPLTHFQLTESSSSGSVTDSICTAYAPEKSRESNDNATPRKENTNDSASKIQPILENSKKEETGLTSMFEALFQSTNILMSSSKKLIDAESSANIKAGEKLPSSTSSTPKSSNCTVPYKFNYTDFNDIDHRLKLYFYQTKFEDANEHFKWLVRGRIYNENTRTLHAGIVVVSTMRLYLMEAFAPENDSVTKWLRPIVSVSVDRLESIQLLPWKLGCSFVVRDWGGFILLLQDILRTDSLLLYFANNALPTQCELLYQPAECITKRLSDAANGDKLNMFALLNGCEISCDNAKRSFQICGLLATDTHLYLTTDKLTWLSQQASNLSPDELELERCVTQLISNLVDVEVIAENVRVINFLDETQNTCEAWQLTFETKENADCSLNAIGQGWEKLFGVSLFGA